MKFKIENVNPENKYLGSYKRIFDILNKDRIFSEVYETEESKGFLNGVYYLEISENPDFNILEQILKIKNVKLA